MPSDLDDCVDHQPSESSTQKRKKRPVKSSKSKTDKIKELKVERKALQTELGQANSALEHAQSELAKALQDCKNKQHQLDNMVKDGNGVDPQMVEKLQKELDLLKKDYDGLLKSFKECQENGPPDDATLTPDHDLPLDAWTNDQLISGCLASNRDSNQLQEEKDALILELESMKKTLRKHGLNSKIEMNQEMKSLLREVLKQVTYHNIKMVWKDKPDLMKKLWGQLCQDFLVSEMVVARHEEHNLSLDEMIRIYGEDLWEHFKTLRQTTQTDLANAAFGECTRVVCILRLIHPSIRALFVPLCPTKCSPCVPCALHQG